MRNKLYNSTILISVILVPILFSCATTQQKQSESRDAESYLNRGMEYGEKGQYDRAGMYLKSWIVEVNGKFIFYWRKYIFFIRIVTVKEMPGGIHERRSSNGNFYHIDTLYSPGDREHQG